MLRLSTSNETGLTIWDINLTVRATKKLHRSTCLTHFVKLAQVLNISVLDKR